MPLSAGDKLGRDDSPARIGINVEVQPFREA
jgi:hypothetical protein